MKVQMTDYISIHSPVVQYLMTTSYISATALKSRDDVRWSKLETELETTLFSYRLVENLACACIFEDKSLTTS